ncbi:MAG: hypothetical protein KGH75_01015 [Rhodospirillales bacterium]|nr:hypothetical protein [Rhodospirillales bacterium]
MSGVITSFVDFGAPLHAADLNNAFAEAAALTALASPTTPGAALVGYSGRTVAAKLADKPGFLDFGGTMGAGGSASVNTAALNALAAAVGPGGIYDVPGGILEFTAPAPAGGIWRLEGTIYSGGSLITSWDTVDLIENTGDGRYYIDRPHSLSSVSPPWANVNFTLDDEVGTPGSSQTALSISASQGTATWQHSQTSAVGVGIYLDSYASISAGTTGSGLTASWPQPVALQSEITRQAGDASMFVLNLLAADDTGLPSAQTGGMGFEYDYIIGAVGGTEARDNNWIAPGSWSLYDNVLESHQPASTANVPYIYAFERYRPKRLPAGYASYGNYVAANAVLSADDLPIMSWGAALDLSNLYQPASGQTWLGTTGLRLRPGWLIDLNAGGWASYSWAVETAAPSFGGGGYSTGDTITLSGGSGTAPVLTVSSVGYALSAATVATPGAGYKIGDGFVASGGTLASGGSQLVISVQNVGNSAASATLASPGSGYVVNEVVTLAAPASVAPGHVGQAVTITVLSVGSGGAIATYAIRNIGTYDTIPANPVAQASSTGAGTGASFDLTWLAEGPGEVTAIGIEVAGGYAATPVGDLVQAATNGLGSGLTLAPTWTTGAVQAVSVTTPGDWTTLPAAQNLGQASSSGAGTGALFRVGFVPASTGTNNQNTLSYDPTSLALEYSSGGVTAAHLGLIGSVETAGNTAATLDLKALNASAAEVIYSQVLGGIISATAGTETGRLQIWTRQSGTLTLEFNAAGGIAIGAPTGGPMGVGTLNCTGLYVNGVAVTVP